jgi:hypothetical protein
LHLRRRWETTGMFLSDCWQREEEALTVAYAKRLWCAFYVSRCRSPFPLAWPGPDPRSSTVR